MWPIPATVTYYGNALSGAFWPLPAPRSATVQNGSLIQINESSFPPLNRIQWHVNRPTAQMKQLWRNDQEVTWPDVQIYYDICCCCYTPSLFWKECLIVPLVFECEISCHHAILFSMRPLLVQYNEIGSAITITVTEIKRMLYQGHVTGTLICAHVPPLFQGLLGLRRQEQKLGGEAGEARERLVRSSPGPA